MPPKTKKVVARGTKAKNNKGEISDKEIEKQNESNEKIEEEDMEKEVSESDDGKSRASTSDENKKKKLHKRDERTNSYKKNVLAEYSDDDEEDEDVHTKTERPPKSPPATSRKEKHDIQDKRRKPPAPRSERPEFSGDEEDDIQNQRKKTKGKYLNPSLLGVQSLWTVLSIVLIFFAIILGWMVTDFSSNIITPSFGCIKRDRSDRFKILQDELGSLPKEYPSLNPDVWDVIAGASYGHFTAKTDPVSPVVLFLAGEQNKINASDVALDVADMYANIYTKRRADSDITFVRGTAFEGKSPNKVKKTMDSIIRKGLTGCSNVVLITNVEKIPACSMILYHGYCDNDNPHFTDAVFIFTMNLEKTTSGAMGTDESIIERQLEKLWSKCPEEIPSDKMVAMFSRVTNNAVILKQ